MPTVSLQAHFDGERIQLDEPYELPANSRLLVTVMPAEAEESFEQWREDWFRLSLAGLARAYGDDEPEYTLDDVKWP